MHILAFIGSLLYKLLYLFTIIKETVKSHMEQIYISNDTVKKIADGVSATLYNVNSLMKSHKIERLGDWCAVFHNEKQTLTECYMEVCDMDDITIGSDNNDILVLKIDGKYVFRLINSAYNTPDNLQSTSTQTTKYFISISYTHPDMTKNIDIDLVSGMYRDKNQILSSTFVLWYLEHQPNPFIFDEKYILKIMDSDIKYIELKSDEYILLEKSKYTICAC